MFLMTTLASRDLRGIAFWLMGDLSTALPPGLSLDFLGLGFFVATGAIYTTASDLNLLLAGEREAMHLGVDVTRVKLVVYVSASVLTGLAVSVSGAIGYVGLLVPHVMRMLFGSDYRLLIPTAAHRRRHRCGLRRYSGAHRRCAHGTARRRHDGHGRRARIHLPAAPEAGMSAPSLRPRAANPARPAARAELRPCASTSSKPAMPTPRDAIAAPLFTLEATTFQARDRELVAILGPNASGKSTLLQLIAGALAPLSGRVELDGFDTSRLDAAHSRAAHRPGSAGKPAGFPARAGDYVLQGRHPHGRSLWFESKTISPSPTTPWRKWAPHICSDRWMHQDFRRRKAARGAGARAGAAAAGPAAR